MPSARAAAASPDPERPGSPRSPTASWLWQSAGVNGPAGGSLRQSCAEPGTREAVASTNYLLAIDQGTTSTRAILFDAAGAVHHSARIELTQHYPQPGWVEHDPEEIWAGVVATCREAIAAAANLPKAGPIAAIGITNQRETAVLWDRASGRAMHNAIVWQDRRTAPL